MPDPNDAKPDPTKVPIPFPAQVQPVRLRVRSFYVREVPFDDPQAPAWPWACEDCGVAEIAHDPTEFGWQLASHMKTCKG
jgi:hypothetical protein